MLGTIQQLDFSAGMFRSVARHLVPNNAVYDLQNLLLEDDGSAFKRGGSVYQSNADFGTGGLRFIWAGALAVGDRVLYANTSDFGTLDSNDATPINLGSAGLTNPVRAVELGGMVFIPGGFIYGGSRKTATYSTGTVTATNGSKTVTGAGTTWSTLVDAGMIFRTAAGERAYVVASIDSTTQLTLAEAYEGTTGAGKAYTLETVHTVGTPYKSSSYYAVVGDRLVAANGSKAEFSEGRNPTTGTPRPHSFQTTDYHEFPEPIIGLASLRDRLIVFTTRGIHMVSNMAYDLTDPEGNVQHRVEQLSDEQILWSNEGIATWRNSLVVPCTDGVWLIDGVSAPTQLARSIWTLIAGYARAGYKTGIGTVYRSHYILPVLDSLNAMVDCLVCRLDRPVEVSGYGRIWPWTRLTGHAANVTGATSFALSGAQRTPKLFGASKAATGRVLDLSRLWEPAGTYKQDADATTFEEEVTLRDYTPNDGKPALVRRFRAWYELEDAASDNPTLQAYYSVNRLQAGTSVYGTAVYGTGTYSSAEAATDVLLAGNAPENDGRDPYVWPMQVNSRRIRFKLRLAQPAARFVLRGVELFVRPGGRA